MVTMKILKIYSSMISLSRMELIRTLFAMLMSEN